MFAWEELSRGTCGLPVCLCLHCLYYWNYWQSLILDKLSDSCEWDWAIWFSVLTFSYFIFIYLQYWGLNLGPTPWATSLALFKKGFFKIGSHELFSQLALYLLISASWVARITGVSHWCLATLIFYTWFLQPSNWVLFIIFCKLRD
jgi:hypothetical protein